MGDVPVLLVVSARSGSGKTTLLEGLLPALAARGVRAAAVKLTHHDVDPDTPGKDSHRLRTAGAHVTVLAAPGLTSVFGPGAGDGPPDVMALARLAAAAASVDIVLVEGGRDEPRLPRIEVVSPGVSPVASSDLLIAVVSDDVEHATAPTLRRDDHDGLADHVAVWLSRKLRA